VGGGGFIEEQKVPKFGREKEENKTLDGLQKTKKT
jgi:hypothetical protein